MAEARQSYLQDVRHFCVHSQNDWYRVYLVRQLASRRGMEFVQHLSAQGHPCQWVFPSDVITQQVRRRDLPAGRGATCVSPACCPV